jgi:hypothetical protein
MTRLEILAEHGDPFCGTESFIAVNTLLYALGALETARREAPGRNAVYNVAASMP